MIHRGKTLVTTFHGEVLKAFMTTSSFSIALICATSRWTPEGIYDHIFFFDRLDLCHKSLDSGERQ